jgi:MoaA/NifB/PqqE/SkfB family radical SAM enzyme
MQPLDFPNNIQIETTSRCNAHCSFCPYPATSKEQPQGNMDDDLFESVIEQISHHPIDLLQPFLNNDPLMDGKIVSRLELMIRMNPGVRVSVTTNGLLLKPEIARALAAMPLHTIHISSNGLTAATYRETMGIDGYAVLKNVNDLWNEMRRRGSKTRLVVTAILMRANREEVFHLRDYWRSRGVTVYLNPLNDRAGNIAEDRFLGMLPLSDEANRAHLHRYSMSGCPAPFSFMAVLWNGDLVTCCMDWRRAQVMGNAREAPLYDLWHGWRYRAMRRLSDEGRLDAMPLCRNCGENRFRIDPQALRSLHARQRAERSPASRASDEDILRMLESCRRQTPDLIQLGLVGA